jgi:hypothetical protein
MRHCHSPLPRYEIFLFREPLYALMLPERTGPLRRSFRQQVREGQWRRAIDKPFNSRFENFSGTSEVLLAILVRTPDKAQLTNIVSIPYE